MDQRVNIKVIGVGGAGCNAINRMVDKKVQGAKFYVCNTDAQVLTNSSCQDKILLGNKTTKGLGAGGKSETGQAAAIESETEIREVLKDADLLILACGEGGGTGTGASPVIAKIAKDMGVLSIAVVTTPFIFEGAERNKQATTGILTLKNYIDAVSIVSNDKLLVTMPNLPVARAFEESDEILRQCITILTNLIQSTSFINVDFADVTTVLKESGNVAIGIGIAKGEDKAKVAAQRAIVNPLSFVSPTNAKAAIIDISGGANMTLEEASIAIEVVKNKIGQDVDVFYSTSINEGLGDAIVVSIVVAGIDCPDYNRKIEDNIVLNPRKGNTLNNNVSLQEKQNQNSEINAYLNNQNLNLFPKAQRNNGQQKNKPPGFTETYYKHYLKP